MKHSLHLGNLHKLTLNIDFIMNSENIIAIPDLPKLKRSSYESIFNVYADEDGRYYYNLLQTVVIPKNLPNGYYILLYLSILFFTNFIIFY